MEPRKNVLAIFYDEQNIENYNIFDEIAAKYNDTQFNIIGGSRSKNDLTYFADNNFSNIMTVKLEVFKTKTIIMGSFSGTDNNDHPSSNIFKIRNMCVTTTGNILNFETLSLKYGISQIKNQDEFLIQAYIKLKNIFNVNTIKNFTNIINECEGNFSIILLDMEIQKAFIYRKNDLLYYRNNFNKGMFFTTTNLEIGNDILQDIKLLPNNTCLFIDLKKFNFTQSQKIKNFDKILNPLTTLAVFTKADTKLLNDINEVFNPQYFICLNSEDLPLATINHKVLNKLEVVTQTIENDYLEIWRLALESLNFAIKNNIGNIIIPNLNNSNSTLINIFETMSPNLPLEFLVFPIYSNMSKTLFLNYQNENLKNRKEIQIISKGNGNGNIEYIERFKNLITIDVVVGKDKL